MRSNTFPNIKNYNFIPYGVVTFDVGSCKVRIDKEMWHEDFLFSVDGDGYHQEFSSSELFVFGLFDGESFRPLIDFYNYASEDLAKVDEDDERGRLADWRRENER